MKNEYQDPQTHLTILQHGLDVHKHFLSLIDYLSNNHQSYPMPIPTWLIQYKDIFLAKCLPNMEAIKNYLIYHDCGKPYCLEIDINGKRHFPNHAQISKQYFLKYSKDLFIAELISKDMLCHITKPKNYKSLVGEEHIEILLCTALAAIHSNAQIFGGTNNDSFKIKLKNLEKLGQRIMNELVINCDQLKSLTTKEKIYD